MAVEPPLLPREASDPPGPSVPLKIAPRPRNRRSRKNDRDNQSATGRISWSEAPLETAHEAATPLEEWASGLQAPERRY